MATHGQPALTTLSAQAVLASMPAEVRELLLAELKQSLTTGERTSLIQELKRHLTTTEKAAIVREFKEVLATPDYILYNVGYEERLATEARVNIMWDFLEDELQDQSLLLAVNGRNIYRAWDQQRRARVFYPHPETAAVLAAIKADRDLTKYSRCLLVKYSGHDDHQNIVQAVEQCEHCGYLDTVPTDESTYIINVQGEEKIVLVLRYDSESG